MTATRNTAPHTLVVAEKPSVARDIARVLGARQRGDGQLRGNGYTVTWALGHLVHFAEPDDYPDWKGRWTLDPLPMVPAKWKLKLAGKTAKQYKIVESLLKAADTGAVVCATDAGREGELIFRLIYQRARCNKPVQRLWISSLTDEAIRQGFARLRAGADYDPLADAARARAQADWLVGLNLTRAYTVRHNALLTIGRVQTPTLAMLVKRQHEIDSFKKNYFYELLAHLQEGFKAKYSEDGQTRIEEKKRAEELHRRLEPYRQGTVKKIHKQTKRQRPPALHDLTLLQREANRRFGFTAARTLEYAQALYETHKLISYPRTESRHLSEDMVPQLPKILQGLSHPQAPAALERLRQGHKLSKAYVDKSKLSDHHGILPTGKSAPPNLPPPLARVYGLVVTRFVGMFLPDHVYEETRVELDIGGAAFVARGVRVLDNGWKIVDGPPRQTDPKNSPPADPKADGEDTPQGPLPDLHEGQTVTVDRLEIVERETAPPKRYTDATLLNAMKNAGRQVDDEEAAAAMKDSGLGTPATRAETLEKLLRADLAQRQGKALEPTAKGRALIQVVDDALKSPELTGQWEQRLRDVEGGALDVATFYASIVDFVNQRVEGVRQSPPADLPPEARQRAGKKGKGKRSAPQSDGTPLAPCPQCGKGQVVERPKGYGCSRFSDGCRFIVWKQIAKKNISPSQAKELIAQGKTPVLRGFRSKAGKPFSASLRLDADFAVQMVFDDQPTPNGASGPQATGAKTAATKAPAGKTASTPVGLPCPRCGEGALIQGKRGYGCRRYREGCDFVVWMEYANKKMTPRQLATLVAKGRTGVLSGFKDGDGTAFKARLRLDEKQQVQLEQQAD